MLTIARAFVRSDVPVRSDEVIESVGRRTYHAAGEAAHELEEIPDPGVEIEVREGTLSVAAAIMAGAVALHIGITAYDSLWSGSMFGSSQGTDQRTSWRIAGKQLPAAPRLPIRQGPLIRSQRPGATSTSPRDVTGFLVLRNHHANFMA